MKEPIVSEPAGGEVDRARVAREFLTCLARHSSGPVILLGDTQRIEFGEPTDLDIAVAEEGRAQRAALIRKALRHLPWPAKLIQVIQHEARAHYFVVAVDVGGRWLLIQPDMTTDYAREGRTFISFEELASDTQPLSGLPLVVQPGPAVATRYYVAKRVSKGSIDEDSLAYLRNLLQSDPARTTQGVGRLLGEEAAASIIASVETGGIDAFNTAAGAARRELYERHRLRWVDRLAEIGRIARRILEPAGFSIAVYGTDGSGKGTLLEALRHNVGPAFRAVSDWHMFAAIDPERPNEPVTDPHGQAPRSNLVSLGKLGWYFCLAGLRRAPTIALARTKAQLVLLDRDVADLWLDPRRYRFALPAWLLRLTTQFGPRPDIELVLHAAAEVVLARSNETDAATINRLAAKYLRFASSRRRATVLDASGSKEAVAYSGAEAAFAALEARTLRRLGLASEGAIGDTE